MTVDERSEHSTTGSAPSQMQVGEVVSVGGLSHGRLMSLAAAAPDETQDPVAAAVARAIQAHHPEVVVPRVEREDIDPARPDRRYSVVRIRALLAPDGVIRDVMVMRGEVRSVLAQAVSSSASRSILRKNASRAASHGGRPLAIAAAPVAADGSIGAFRLQGFVAVHPAREGASTDTDSEDDSWVRIDLWTVSLRYQHWLNVILIFVLSCTGYYIMDPFFGPTARDGEPTGYLMGWVRLIHVTAGFAWLLVGATRLVSAFSSRDGYLRWQTMWPLKSRADLRHLGEVIKHYAFIKRDAPLYLAHNPLQQLSYTALYIGASAQMATGSVLYGLSHQSSAFWALVSTPVHWFGIAPVRLVHAMLMFVLWAFTVIHIYLAVRADSLERHSGVSSMINGGVWLRRGSKPVDAPEVG